MDGTSVRRNCSPRPRIEVLESRDLLTGVISGCVFEDLNNNGYKEATEPGIAGTVVQLKNASGQVVSSATTNANGQYSFTGLVPGQYSVCEPNQPAGYLDWKDWSTAQWSVLPGSVGSDTIPVQLNANSDSIGNNFGEVKPGTISGNVFVDMNANGIKETGDLSSSGISMVLVGTDYQGNSIRLTTTTDNFGNYSFGNLLPGNYIIGMRNHLKGYKVGKSYPGSLGGVGTTEQIGVVSLLSGQTSTNNNFTDEPIAVPFGKRDFLGRPKGFIPPLTAEPAAPARPIAPPIPTQPVVDPGTNPNANTGSFGKRDFLGHPRANQLVTANTLSNNTTNNPIVNPQTARTTRSRF